MSQSSFSFKGEKIGIKEIGEKLGVQYVVEGSVRRGGNRTRITAQLIEAETGNHIWAERYDRELEDIFAVQDEVTRAIVATVAAQLGRGVHIADGNAMIGGTIATTHCYGLAIYLPKIKVAQIVLLDIL